jgi:hypothetical protein
MQVVWIATMSKIGEMMAIHGDLWDGNKEMMSIQTGKAISSLLTLN